jgi:hypothetical protein
MAVCSRLKQWHQIWWPSVVITANIKVHCCQYYCRYEPYNNPLIFGTEFQIAMSKNFLTSEKETVDRLCSHLKSQTSLFRNSSSLVDCTSTVATQHWLLSHFQRCNHMNDTPHTLMPATHHIHSYSRTFTGAYSSHFEHLLQSQQSTAYTEPVHILLLFSCWVGYG